jgi:hypothetical protein
MEEGWILLPFDLFYRVAVWCDAKSVARAGLVCRNWFDNSNSQHIWKVITFDFNRLLITKVGSIRSFNSA